MIFLRLTTQVALMITTILLAGCQDSSSINEKKAHINDLKQQALSSKNATENLEYQQPTPVVYQSSTTVSNDEGEAVYDNAKNKESINPLNKFPIDEYQYVGILRESNKIYGYLQAPDGLLYKIGKGDLIGTTYAEVANITEDKINLVEKRKTKENQVVERVKIIELKGSHDD